MHYVRLPILPLLPEVARCIYRFRGECRRTRNFDCSEFNERNECQTKMTKGRREGGGRERSGGSWVMLTVGGLISCAICQLGLFLALSLPLPVSFYIYCQCILRQSPLPVPPPPLGQPWVACAALLASGSFSFPSLSAFFKSNEKAMQNARPKISIKMQ